MEVHALDVGGILSENSLKAVVSFTIIVIIYTAELALKLRSDILKLKMLIHIYITPV